MTSNRTLRSVLTTLALSALVAVVLLFVFHSQYRGLVDQLVSARISEYTAQSEADFELQATTKVAAAATSLASTADDAQPEELLYELNQILHSNQGLTGVQYESSTGISLRAGSFPESAQVASTTWLAERLVIPNPVVSDGVEIGTLAGVFDLTALHDDASRVTANLSVSQSAVRNSSYAWAAGGTLLVVLIFAFSILGIFRRQASRIQELKTQAEKLRDADFGTPLLETRNDDLGDLAVVFNDLRERLQNTTSSRDYVDSILSGMNEAIIVTNDDGRITRINTATTHLLGYEENELDGTNIDYVVNTAKSRSLAEDSPSRLPKESIFESKFGESIPVSYTCSVVPGENGEPQSKIYAAQNITERQRAEKRIRYLARIDPLTKIPNRMQFQHLLQRNIARARRSGKSLCLFYVDIDHFKEINDTFGHLAGDTTLETVAERLKSALPGRSIIGRLAGDEFAVIVDDLRPDDSGIKETSDLAQKLLDRLADPFFVQGHEVFMTASLGVAFYPKDAPNVIDLIRNADAALYHAKKSGGNVYSFYAPKMNEASVERLMTKSKLKRAFERDELLVHYQPKYNLETGQVFGAEALVRWETPERGLILPSDFIPIAEDSSLIIEIGEWVLDKVCEDFRIWQRTVPSPGRVSVNLSLKQLRQRNFIDRISAIMRGHEISPTSLELEITETTLMENPERTIRMLDELYGLGLHLAIDDFGTGYSSLSALQQFPISTLKIDQSFVRDIVTNPDDATIVDTIIKMGQNLNMDVVAEGVEEEGQLNFLQKLGCTYAQGLLFGEPMSADNYLELLHAQVDGTDSYRTLFA